VGHTKECGIQRGGIYKGVGHTKRHGLQAHLICVGETRKAGGIMVDYHKVGTLQSLDLVDHQVASLVVHVIANNKPFCNTTYTFVMQYYTLVI